MISRNQKRLLIAILLFPFTVAVAAELISADSNGNQGDDYSGTPSISADGRFVAFTSAATNLIAGSTTTGLHVFVRDRVDNTIKLVSVDRNGVLGDRSSEFPSISADGCSVAFVSEATNLIAGVTTTRRNIFVHECLNNTTELISMDSGGSHADADSWFPSISADGHFVAFASEASNLVANDTNNQSDVFVHERQSNSTQRISVGSNGEQGDSISGAPSISADGHFVAFVSEASNLVANDSNGVADVFVHDRQSNSTQRISVGSNSDQGDRASGSPSISADGRFVVFVSEATNLIAGVTTVSQNIFVRDRQTNTTELISVSRNGIQGGNQLSDSPSISADGRFVAFQSHATDLVDDDTNNKPDFFVYDRTTKTTERVSIADDGRDSNSDSWNPSISGDGSVVVFESDATNLVAGGSNGINHIFLAHRLVRGGDAVSVPVMGAGVLIALISLVGGMALRMRARFRR